MATPESARLLPLAESIADGSPVDWDAAQARASDDDQAIIRELRVVASLAMLHRSLPAGPARFVTRRTSPAPAIGNWGHLALIERIGGGTSGEVYRAWDPQLECEVALKLLRGQETTDDPRLSPIAKEGRLLARVRHPNVITVHGVAVHDGRFGLWMQLARGSTLEQLLLKQGPFSAREATLIGIDLCRALAAIHAAGLIHRDVKAQNVMREDGGRIVLMDLGTGRDIESGRHGLPDVAGTPQYLAPEIFEGAAASEGTDLYSLGVLLYHLVTGLFPVRATTIDELTEGHAKGTGVRLRDARADLPTTFVRVVDRAIAKDPSRRYVSAGALESDLVNALHDVAAGDTGTEKDGAWRLTWSRAGMLVATLVVAVTLAVEWPTLRGWMRPAGASGPIRSIAVLPLANLSGDPAQEYFADGMTDELIGTLGRLHGVNVISRTSTMQFKGSKVQLPQIARALNVDAVLEGSVLVIPENRQIPLGGGQRVRINARLIYAATEIQLWDRTFEKVVDDVLGLQSEVARAVSDGIDSRLAAQVLGSQVNRTVDPKSYDAYLRGRYLANKRTPADLRNAIEQFKKAVDVDPTSALAWAGLADGYGLLASYDEEDPRQAWPRAKAAATRALDLEDSSAEAHALLGAFEWTYQWDLPAAEREFARALALNPNYATAHARYGLYLNEVGRFDQALAEMKRAQQLDPLSLVTEVNLARCYYFARRYDQALALLGQLARREPDFWIVHAILGQTYIAQNRLSDAIRELVRARQLSPSSVRNFGVLGDAFGRAGRGGDAMKLADELSQLSGRQYVSPIYSTLIYMGLGDHRRALDFLERAFLERSDWIMQLNVDPEFDPIRAEPRFRELLRRAGQALRLP